MQEVSGTGASMAPSALDGEALRLRLRQQHGDTCPESMRARKEQWYYVRCKGCGMSSWICSQENPEQQRNLFCVFGYAHMGAVFDVQVLHRAIDIWPEEE